MLTPSLKSFSCWVWFRSRKRDEEVLKSIRATETTFVFNKRNNKLRDLMKNSVQRNTHAHRTKGKRDDLLDDYHDMLAESKALKSQVGLLKDQARELLVEETRIRVQGVTQNTPGPLCDRLKVLVREQEKLLSRRHALRAKKKEIDDTCATLRSTDLKGVRLGGARPRKRRITGGPDAETIGASKDDITGGSAVNDPIVIDDSDTDDGEDEGAQAATPNQPSSPVAGPSSVAWLQSTSNPSSSKQPRNGDEKERPYVMKESEPTKRPRPKPKPRTKAKSPTASGDSSNDAASNWNDPFFGEDTTGVDGLGWDASAGRADAEDTIGHGASDGTPGDPLEFRDGQDFPDFVRNFEPSMLYGDLGFSLPSNEKSPMQRPSERHSMASQPSPARHPLDCNPRHPEDWPTPNKTRTMAEAHPNVWNHMLHYNPEFMAELRAKKAKEEKQRKEAGSQ